MKWLSFFLFPVSLFASFQVWNTDNLSIRFARKFYLTGETEFRYGERKTKLYYKHYQGGILYTYSPYTLFHIGYRQIYQRINQKWQKEYEPLFDLTFQIASRHGLHISDRSRLEYQISNQSPNRWLYRNRFEIVFPFRLFRNFTPFLADEFFWLETRGINENRLEGGFKIPYHQKTQLNLSYICRLLKNPQKDWTHQNVFRIHFFLYF
jgi:hypothetical protein